MRRGNSINYFRSTFGAKSPEEQEEINQLFQAPEQGLSIYSKSLHEDGYTPRGLFFRGLFFRGLSHAAARQVPPEMSAASGPLRTLQQISEDSDERVAWEELEGGATLAPHAAFFLRRRSLPAGVERRSTEESNDCQTKCLPLVID